MKLSIIIPVFNEWRTILELLEKLKALRLDKEIIIVDDASTDGTTEILKKVSDPLIRVIRHNANQGKGAAIRTALPLCTGDMVIIQDADLEQDPDDIYSLVAPIMAGGAHVVYGSRFLNQQPRMKRTTFAANVFLSWLTFFLYSAKISDLETCYKVFERQVIAEMPLTASGFEFEPEVTAKVLRSGYEIFEVPIKEDWFHGYDSNSKKVRWTDGVIAVVTLFRFMFWKPTAEAVRQRELIRVALLSRRIDSPTHSSSNRIS